MVSSIIRRNNVKIFGSGTQPMMFAHGFGCDQNMWRYLTSAFEADYRIILFDYVGAGRSNVASFDAERYENLHGYAQDVLDICEALELKDVIFVGHSVSSIIGMLASIRAPQYFSQLIMIGPSPCYLNEDGYKGGFDRQIIEDMLDSMKTDYTAWAQYFAPLVMKNEDRPPLVKELEDSFCATEPHCAHAFAQATFLSDHREDLEHVEVPALILQCAADSIAPSHIGDYVHAHLQFSTLYRMEATGHCPHVSHPEETRELILRYLATVPA